MDNIEGSEDHLECVLDQLGDVAQSLVAVIEHSRTTEPKAKLHRTRLIAARLHLLAEKVTPPDWRGPDDIECSAAELTTDLIDLSQRADAVIHKVCHSVPMSERVRVGILCQLNNLRVLLAMLTSMLSPDSGIARLLEFTA